MDEAKIDERPTKVTITGADDSTDIKELIELSSRFPFVEWGILVSKSQEGSPRFPGAAWMSKFTRAAELHALQVSVHLCGEWVRKLLQGKLQWAEVPGVINVAKRVQINTHAQPHLVHAGALASNLASLPGRQFIFQRDLVNDGLSAAVKGVAPEANVACLFDTSGGAGVLPASWPVPFVDIPCGYAGGLGPKNVLAQIRAIEEVCTGPYWIDMERRVRTEDDSALNLGAVAEVLILVEAVRARDGATPTTRAQP